MFSITTKSQTWGLTVAAINGTEGNDTISSGGIPAVLVDLWRQRHRHQYHIHLGDGDNRFYVFYGGSGGGGADVINGGSGHDFLTGQGREARFVTAFISLICNLSVNDAFDPLNPSSFLGGAMVPPL